MAETGGGGGGAKNTGARPVAEFRLRSTSAASCSHNIMTLAGPSVNMANFTTPVRLIRDPAASREEEDGTGEGEGSQASGGGINAARRRRKTRLIPQTDEEDSTLRAQERAPWLLEDFDGQHSYTSQIITPEAKYVVFVNQGNEFQVLPINKWYRFTPKLSYRPLTLEEAEERMASKGRNEDYDRWLMRKRTANLSGESSSGTASVATSERPAGPVVAKRYVNLEEEGFDFEEFVDDDDGEGLYSKGGGGDEDDPSMPRIERPRPQKSLTEAGRQVKRLVKHLDRTNYLYHDSDDDGHDPYADDADQRESSSDLEDEAARKPTKPPPSAAVPLPKPMLKPALVMQRPAEIPATQKLTAARPLARSRSKSPSAPGSRARSVSPQPSSSNASRSGASSPPRSPTPSVASTTDASSSSANALCEADIVGILRRSSCTTRDLIAAMRDKLKADPQNKDRFREILRRVASIKSGASQEQDKLLELKPEYR